jgi:hypothetical protein
LPLWHFLNLSLQHGLLIDEHADDFGLVGFGLLQFKLMLTLGVVLVEVIVWFFDFFFYSLDLCLEEPIVEFEAVS